jgi:hypothetical protein
MQSLTSSACTPCDQGGDRSIGVAATSASLDLHFAGEADPLLVERIRRRASPLADGDDLAHDGEPSEDCTAQHTYNVYLTTLDSGVSAKLLSGWQGLVNSPEVVVAAMRKGVCAAGLELKQSLTIPPLERQPPYRPSSASIAPTVAVIREGGLVPATVIEAGETGTLVLSNFPAGTLILELKGIIFDLNRRRGEVVRSYSVEDSPEDDVGEAPWEVPIDLPPGRYFFRVYHKKTPIFFGFSQVFEVVDPTGPESDRLDGSSSPWVH